MYTFIFQFISRQLWSRLDTRIVNPVVTHNGRRTNCNLYVNSVISTASVGPASGVLPRRPRRVRRAVSARAVSAGTNGRGHSGTVRGAGCPRSGVHAPAAGIVSGTRLRSVRRAALGRGRGTVGRLPPPARTWATRH